MSYIEESFLIKKLYNYSRSRRKTERKLKRYYPTIISPDLLFREDEHSKSRVFEWLVVNQLKAEFFWRDPYKNDIKDTSSLVKVGKEGEEIIVENKSNTKIMRYKVIVRMHLSFYLRDILDFDERRLEIFKKRVYEGKYKSV